MSSQATHAEMFANRLRKTLRTRRRWARRVPTDAFRVYDRDIPEVPVLVDLYGPHVHIADQRRRDEVESHPSDWLDAIVAAAAEVLEAPAGTVHVKRRERQAGDAQYDRVGEEAVEHIVSEQGLRFVVNLTDYLDTGLFLDHRVLRARVREEAAGKRFLNLFAYTGSFSVYAAAGGATCTTVDLSNTYLDWGRRNMSENGLDADAHEWDRADTFTFLRAAHEEGRCWDLVVVDPPTFSNSKRVRGSFDVQRDHAGLLRQVLAVTAPGGCVYFSNNRRKFRLDDVVSADEITDQTIPDDFSHRRPHRCWRVHSIAPNEA